MNVRELIERLNKLDPELDVLCSTEDEALQSPGHMFRLFEIESVERTRGQHARAEDGIPSIRFGNGPDTTALAIIRVTADF